MTEVQNYASEKLLVGYEAVWGGWNKTTPDTQHYKKVQLESINQSINQYPVKPVRKNKLS